MTKANQIELNINPLTSDEDIIIINQSIENFKIVDEWNGLTTNIIGKRVGIGFSSFTIVGLNKAAKKSKLVLQHVNRLDLYEASFKTVECELRLQGIVPVPYQKRRVLID